MELREFIKDVLLEITGGVEDAQNASGIQLWFDVEHE